MHGYNHKEIEQKWQKRWEESQAHAVSEDSKKEKLYLLIEFPYPSGAGLHVGHVRSYTAMDAIARKKRAEGKNVLFPIGWDAFGLPTENYAVKTGIHPKEVTRQNTDTFRRQLKLMGFSFDWSREINTTDPAYYKWTQWIFLQLFKKGLAYKAKMPINWCPSCKIGLANEEVIDGGKCERCGADTEKREKEQWMLAITKYADRLDKDLDLVDFWDKIKIQQRNWIGRSEGAELDFKVKDVDASVTVFTTRADTLFGATFLVLAPEHPLVDTLKDQIQNWDEVYSYILETGRKSEIDRTNDEKEKTGVELKGVKAVNPGSGEEIPVFIADYVLMHYGTGAIMAVPAHDERDYAFAEKFKIPVISVIERSGILVSGDLSQSVAEGKVIVETEIWTGSGKLKNSAKFDGMDSEEAKKKITESVGGRMKVTYKLRDWVFSRQRYWGEPIPLIHCDKCGEKDDEHGGWIPVPEAELPVTLPDTPNFKPTDSGEAPLAAIKEWVEVKCPKCQGPARRETDTMPNWAGSSWYYLRYADAHNDREFASREKLDYWTPVDWYNGGMEHTTLHLLYSRFWHKFLYDLGLVPSPEPYMKRTSHGLILANDGSKMSKSKGNVVNPDDVVNEFGADALRLGEMFMGPFDQPVAWSTDVLHGVSRFLRRVYDLRESVGEATMGKETETLMHQTIGKVSKDIDDLRMNTIVSALMTYLNHLEKLATVPTEAYTTLLQLLSPFAPHMTHELWEEIGKEGEIQRAPWPVADPSKMVAETMKVAVQVNGKVRATLEFPSGVSEGEVKAAAKGDSRVSKWLSEGSISKEIYVPGRLLSFVVEKLDQK